MMYVYPRKGKKGSASAWHKLELILNPVMTETTPPALWMMTFQLNPSRCSLKERLLVPYLY
jgi:hypothetical protein